MNRIETTFQKLKDKKEKALVGFVTAGDPDREKSLSLIRAMVENGMDILELGVPFSDPTSDGPVIQRSSFRALKKGMTLAGVLEMTKAIREFTDIPIILFSYYNPILAYGAQPFYKDSVSAGANGLLVVDLPPEESHEMTDLWEGSALSLIRLIAPTTPFARMKEIAENASGFLYLVSMTGVTGSSGLHTQSIRKTADDLRSATMLPVCIGFGISTPEHVREIGKMAEGVVIGSAFERIIEENQDKENLAQIIGQMTEQFKSATRNL